MCGPPKNVNHISHRCTRFLIHGTTYWGCGRVAKIISGIVCDLSVTTATRVERFVCFNRLKCKLKLDRPFEGLTYKRKPGRLPFGCSLI